ncbi:MAG: ABC transporter ATP-binding protein [Deltaproteobacteria bacterium]|nr:ABC transporter ATP-binding protein [Deltaproteobacteria bacterium]MBW2046344.1 ABC transporter ATP-binding protein [Deltaproteobacteria bacterium]MBW2299574.1 ABC transporter ATP-binding protein [Deltaproteobacteria bacterium]
MGVIFKAEEVSLAFGGIKALDGFSIELEENTITALIGPNGAGKTTFFNVAGGIYPPDGGAVYFRGERVDGLRPDQICMKGLTRTFQIARELGEMSVWENVMLAPKGQVGERVFSSLLRWGTVKKQEKENWEKAEELLKEMGLYEERNELCKNLSAGKRKMLEICRAIMTGPELLMLDEPTAGATVDETKSIMGEIERLREEHGLTFLVVEHKMDVIMNLCNPIYVMYFGRNLAKGDAEAIQHNEQVREVYLGG